MLRTAQIGLGWWGSQVTKVLKGSEKIEMVCGVEPVPAIAQQYTETYGLPVHADYQTALDDPAVEAVILTIPHRLHEDALLRASLYLSNFWSLRRSARLKTGRRTVRPSVSLHIGGDLWGGFSTTQAWVFGREEDTNWIELARMGIDAVPIMTRLDSGPINPRAIMDLRITMVLDSEISAPSHNARYQPQPSAKPIPMPRPMQRNIWIGVPRSAIRRTGYTGWLRNIAVALGNLPPATEAEWKAVIAALDARREHPSPMVREHVVWALQSQLQKGSGFRDQ